ncbi:MAG: FAD-binding protein [Victivallaceae bacterium]|nr:FAD-binding protein [Victivallaceae bacterium]
MLKETRYSYNELTLELVQNLKAIVGEQYVIYDDVERLEQFSHDETPGDYVSMPAAAIRPRTAEEIAAIIKLANRENIPITPRGAGSGLSGGAVPIYGGLVLSVDRMNSILEVDRDNMMIEVEPGVVANDINEHIEPFNLFYAGYPMSLETCFIGGNVAENAGGGKAVKYGVTSRYVLGLEVVTPTGEIIELGGKLVKDVTGYNMVQLMVGSEGTLGIFTKIILKLLPLPKIQADLLCLFKTSDDAISAVPKIMTGGGVIPTSIEFMDSHSVQAACEYLNESLPYEDCGAMLLISVDGMDRDVIEEQYITIGKFCQEAGAIEVYVADNPSTSERIWKVRRNIAEAFSLIEKRQFNDDIVVPPASIPAAIAKLEEISAKYQVQIPCFGHAGDGNIHARVLCRKDWDDKKWAAMQPVILKDMYQMIREQGGRLSGEHGVGCKRKKYLNQVVSEEYINMLRTVKRAFDPNNILNPGKIFDV